MKPNCSTRAQGCGGRRPACRRGRRPAARKPGGAKLCGCSAWQDARLYGRPEARRHDELLVSELLILANGRVLAHNLTPVLAQILDKLNLRDESSRYCRLRRKAQGQQRAKTFPSLKA